MRGRERCARERIHRKEVIVSGALTMSTDIKELIESGQENIILCREDDIYTKNCTWTKLYEYMY